MRVRRGADVAVVAVIAGIGLTACSSGPSIDEVAPQFEQDADAMFDHLQSSYSQDPNAVEVTADGSENISCDDGVKREFDATFPMRDGEPANNLDFFTRAVLVGLEDDHGYTMSDGDHFSGTERTYRATNDDETITFEIHATGDPGSEVLFTGETVCASS